MTVQDLKIKVQAQMQQFTSNVKTALSQLSSKSKVIVVVTMVVVSFGAGRYTVPEKVKTVIQTVQVEKQDDKKIQDTKLDKDEETKTTVVKRPDGTTETIVDTINKDVSNTEVKDVDDTYTSDSKTTQKETVKASSKVTVSILAGGGPSGSNSSTLNSFSMVYGCSVTKPVLGPLTVGAWALSNGTLGGSLGVTF